MDENLQMMPDVHDVVSRATYYNNLLEAYKWHFRIKERPATFEELVRFANWTGLENKQPTKIELVEFFLEQKITF